MVLDICRRFFKSEISNVIPLGGGHINDTYLVETEDGRYICQRISRDMDTAKLEYNYCLYSKACDEYGLAYPSLLKTYEGDFFVVDPSGDSWRVYPMIDGDILTPPVREEMLKVCGTGLAKLHEALWTIAEKPKANYPHLHDLNYYYDLYKKVLGSDDLCEENRDKTLEELIETRYAEMPYYMAEPKYVIHGDAKLANIIFEDGQVKGFIDFDTIMMGSVTEDVADCIRSACVKDGVIDNDGAAHLTEGYLSAAPKDMADEVRENLSAAVGKICFELGLRYYTDVLSEGTTFTEKYPGYRIDNARNLISLQNCNVL